MDSETMIRVVAGALGIVILIILIYRMKRRATE